MTNVLERLSLIDGLDVKAALKAMGGKPEAYLQVLKLTAKRIPESLNKLDKYISEHNIQAYGIDIHGIKSVLNGIGAFELGSAAYELEKAVKSGNGNFVFEDYIVFKEASMNMTKQISEAFGRAANSDPDFSQIEFITALDKAECAVKDYDNRLALDLLNPFRADETADKIVNALEVFDFNTAGDLIRDRLRSLREPTGKIEGGDCMTTTNGEYYYGIKGLQIPRGEVPDTLEYDINKYIDLVEKVSELAKQNLRGGQTPMLIRNLMMIDAMLRNVYATRLEPEAQSLLDAAEGQILDKCRNDLPGFITKLTELSIEMQKAQNSKSEHIGEKPSAPPAHKEVELHTDLMRDLTAISRFIASGDYERAQALIMAVEKANLPAELQELIAAGKYDEAAKLADELRNGHADYIDNLGGNKGSGIKTVLAVDDKPEILTSIQLALKGHYKVIGVTGGLEAIRFIQKHKPDLFILDIEMPEIDGFQVADIIRENSEISDTPIIFLTGNSSREYVLHAMKLHANDFVVKPADATALLAMVGKYLG